MKKGEYLTVPVLNDQYIVVVTWGDPEQVQNVLKQWHYPDYDNAEFINRLNGNQGTTFVRDGCHPVIAMPGKPKTACHISTLAHEAVHAVAHIFDAIGEHLDGEAFAHSVGAVVRITLQNKNK